MQTSTTHILIWSISGSILVLVIFLSFIFYLIKTYNQKQYEFYKTLKLTQIENEKRLLDTRIEVQEVTMHKISREIHDNVNQLLALSKMNLNSLEDILVDEFKSKVATSKKLITSAIDELTNISRTLNAEIILDYGIAKSLEAEAERINQMEQVKIELVVSETLPKLNGEIEIILYRIFQEAARNAIAHGKAKIITAILNYSNGEILFNIIDNGCGFETSILSSVEKFAHQGVNNIKKRVHLVNGKISIHSEVGKGTQINISIPN